MNALTLLTLAWIAVPGSLTILFSQEPTIQENLLPSTNRKDDWQHQDLLTSPESKLDVAPDPDPARFASSIARFGKEDEEKPFDAGGIVFVGSSSIRRMDIPSLFPGLAALNRGFGGAHISDINYYLEETVLKYKPALTIHFCGGNDLNLEKSPRQVLEDFREFYGRLFERVPGGHLVVLAIRPSPKRHQLFDKQLSLNYLLQLEASREYRITFLNDSCDRFFDAYGNFYHDLYHEDKLHMSAKGYQIWKEILTPFLSR